MMKVITFENIKGQELPLEWAQLAGVHPEERVNVTIQPSYPAKTRRKLDRTAIKRLLDEVKVLPIFDNRTPDEIIGYNEDGLPV